MATHDYSCPACDCRFEVSRPMSELELPVHCATCGARAKRQVSAPRFVFTRASAIDAANAAAHINQSRWNHGSEGHGHGAESANHTH